MKWSSAAIASATERRDPCWSACTVAIKLVYVGRVGTGFGQQAIEALLPRLKAVSAARSPFSGARGAAIAAGRALGET